MKLAVISGKGGTGKTTLAGPLATMIDPNIIKMDCDVDASNLHLLFNGKDLYKKPFYGAKVASINPEFCSACNRCYELCRFDAISENLTINPFKCEGCGTCQVVCPCKAITLDQEITGHTYLTDTEIGKLSRANLFPGAEGSGKLVSEVRKAVSENVFIDGSPGIGCTVMASITGLDYAIIITEPSYSGYEDLKRVYALTQHFNIQTFLVINKYDIHLGLSKVIDDYCQEQSIKLLGKIPFDQTVSTAINAGQVITKYDTPASQAIALIYEALKKEVIL